MIADILNKKAGIKKDKKTDKYNLSFFENLVLHKTPTTFSGENRIAKAMHSLWEIAEEKGRDDIKKFLLDKPENFIKGRLINSNGRNCYIYLYKVIDAKDVSKGVIEISYTEKGLESELGIYKYLIDKQYYQSNIQDFNISWTIGREEIKTLK